MLKGWLLLRLMLLLAGGLLALLGLALAAAPVLPGEILAYARFADGNNDLYLLDIGRGIEVNLTRHPANDTYPVWSPDGEWLVFVSDRDGSSDLYLLRARDRLLHRLTLHPGIDLMPAWSPDGRRIAFAAVRDYSYDTDLFSVEVPADPRQSLDAWPPPDEWPVHILVQSSLNEIYPTYAPDGDRFAYLSAAAPGEIFIGSGQSLSYSPRRLVTQFFGPASLAWSPDGRWLTFTAEGREDDLYLIDSETGQVQTLTGWGGFEYNPSWSPDGREVIFVMDSHIHAITLESRDVRRLTRHRGIYLHPALRPGSSTRP